MLQLQHRVGQSLGFGKLELERAFHAHRFGSRKFFQPLDARLRLARLGGLGAEAIDERLQVRALGLLLRERRLLLVQAFGALAFEVAVVAGVQARAALLQMQHVIDRAVEEFSIVRNDPKRARIAAQPLFEP